MAYGLLIAAVMMWSFVGVLVKYATWMVDRRECIHGNR